jgi:hypothetical protein
MQGAIVLPLVTALRQPGSSFHQQLEQLDAQLAHAIETLFVQQEWLTAAKGPLTAAGKHVLQTSVFSIAASYRPMLHSMEDLLFGDHARVYRRSRDGEETHVDRRLNVIGSGRQHEAISRTSSRKSSRSSISSHWSNSRTLSSMSAAATARCSSRCIRPFAITPFADDTWSKCPCSWWAWTITSRRSRKRHTL